MAAQSKVAPLPPWGYAVAGSSGALIANALVYPLDMVKTRLQVQVKQQRGTGDSEPTDEVYYNGMWDALSRIAAEDGLPGLYNGMGSSLLGVVSTNFAFFYWHSLVRNFYLKSKTIATPPGTAAELAIGAVAGALAQLFTIPVAVITTRQHTANKLDRKGFFATAKEVVESEDGWTGLWRGLKASLVLVVNPSITYGAYERLREGIYPGRTTLKPWETFLLGAMSKTLATIATQPLIVAKVGLQSKPPPSRKGKPFKSFGEVMSHIVKHEGLLGLFKGMTPQILKGLMVQGILMTTKERVELLFVLLFRYLKKVREEKLGQLANVAAEKAKVAADKANLGKIVEVAAEKAKQVTPAILK